jgi:hypothetical protein
MTKTLRPRQLELRVMSNVNGGVSAAAAASSLPETTGHGSCVDVASFHKPASGADQSVYKAISDNYFKAVGKLNV